MQARYASPDKTTLEAVPNFSTGRDASAISAIVAAVGGPGVDVLDVHSDVDHDRCVVTAVGHGSGLVDALVESTSVARFRVDMGEYRGVHPAVGATDVVPVVYLRRADRSRAESVAIQTAEAIGGVLDIPVFLYGAFSAFPVDRSRAFLRRGGTAELARRVERGELRPDFGPSRIDPSVGATLVSARPPLVAFNVDLATRDLDVARAVAGEVRQGEGGLHGVRAIGVPLPSRDRVQISMNIEKPDEVSLGAVFAFVKRAASAHNVTPFGIEIVGLVPARALEGLPDDVSVIGARPADLVLEERVAASAGRENDVSSAG